MFKRCLVASLVSFLSSGVSAQSSFSELVVFGDSLLDSGNFGIRFTNQLTDGSGQFAQIAPQYLADYLGVELEPAALGGTNYAVGGYRTGEVFNSIAGTGIAPTMDFPILGSRASYLAETGGSIASDTLILLDGGGNDLRDILFTDPANAGTLIPTAAQTYVNAVGALHAAGAKYILVANVPDLSITPGVAPLGDPALLAQVSGATAAYNQGVSTLTTLGLSDANIIPVDIAGYVSYVRANAEAYGIASGEVDIGGGVMLDQFSMCYQGPGCVEHPVYGINGSDPDPRRLFFNDTLHPTELSSEIFGDYLIDLIAAPISVGLLPELALNAARTQSSASSNELRRSRWGGLTEGRLFVSGDVASEEYEGVGSPENDNASLTVGRTFVLNESLIYGVALTVAQQELDITGADYESDSWGLTGLMGYRKDGLFVDAVLGLSTLAYDDLKREVRLGSQTLAAKGDTDGSAWNVDILAGYDVLSSETIHIAPAIGVQYINANVEGYSETNGGISSFKWGDQDRKSLQWRYGAVGSVDISQAIKVFGEVFGVEEQESDDETLSITNTNLNNPSYRLPSFSAGDDSFFAATLGGSLRIGEGAQLSLTYNYSDRNDGYEQVMINYSMPM